MNHPHEDVRRRNVRVLYFYMKGITRKQLAIRFRITYELVKKITRGIERRAHLRDD